MEGRLSPLLADLELLPLPGLEMSTASRHVECHLACTIHSVKLDQPKPKIFRRNLCGAQASPESRQPFRIWQQVALRVARAHHRAEFVEGEGVAMQARTRLAKEHQTDARMIQAAEPIISAPGCPAPFTTTSDHTASGTVIVPYSFLSLSSLLYIPTDTSFDPPSNPSPT